MVSKHQRRRRNFTHRHDFPEGLQCGARALTRLSKGLQERRYSLVDGPGTDMLLQNVECFRCRRTYVGVIVDERRADHDDDVIFLPIPLSVGSAFPKHNGQDSVSNHRFTATHISSHSIKQTPSRLRESEEFDVVRRMTMSSDNIFSPDLRQRSVTVRAAVYGGNVSM